jgi:MSHA biogenesis protein MshJ
MRAVIEGLLGRSRGVTLIEMKTLAATTLTTSGKLAGKAAAQPATSDRLIYRHGVELTVAGSYHELLGYVRELERLPTQLYWGNLQLDGSGYPKVAMKLTVYTLSLDPAWLNV